MLYTRDLLKLKRVLLVLLLAISGVLQAQTCDFKVRFDTITATCYNNGKVVYALVDAGGNALTTLPANLTDVRIYYKTADGDKHYGIDYTGGWDTLTLDYGPYTVGVEAACDTGGGYMKMDTSTELSINTSYKKPKASALYVTSHTDDGYGRHPTLNCTQTGRIQLKIEQGRFPYTVTVRRHGTTDTLRTEVFNNYMYSGTDPEKFNYRYYYSVDSLPQGEWDFYVVDGCDYGLPRVTQDVSSIELPKLSAIEVYASSGSFTDSNVVRINAVLDKYYGYYNNLLDGYVQYRFLYDSTPNGDWKPFKANGTSDRVMLKDTASTYSSYCALWGRNITFEYKVAGCGLDETISRSFTYNKPNTSDYHKNVSTKNDSNLVALNTCGTRGYHHTTAHTISYYRNNYSYSPDHVSVDNDDNTNAHYRYHYTHPLTWVYVDTGTGDTIKSQTVASINTASSLTEAEVIARYRSFVETPLTLNVRRTLVDAKGCELYTTTDNLTYAYSMTVGNPYWRIDKSGNDHCCNVKRTVGVWEENCQNYNTGVTTIRLVHSPYNNRYNFTAVFDHATQSWTVSKADIRNRADINGGSGGHSVSLSDYGLPTGPYTFEIESPCDTVTKSVKFQFPDIYSTELVEDPVLTYHQECTDRYIKYNAGQFARVSRNTSLDEGLDLAPKYDTLSTIFTIISGPAGGYDQNTPHHFRTDSARISIPGKYVVEIRPNTSLELCGNTVLYDTIVYDGATVDFEYAYALRCDKNSPSGNVYVKGSNGTAPYTYTLYSEKDKEGTVLGICDSGIFKNVAMNDSTVLSCKVEDACGSYYHVNIIPATLADMQKVWFDGGLRDTTTCEGTFIELNALEQHNIFSYTWQYPDGTTETGSKQQVFIPRGAEEGWYKVTVLNTGCGMVIADSIYLRVDTAPKVTLEGGGTVCPGESVPVTFTPHSTYDTVNPIIFTVAYANGTTVETRTYSAKSGVAVSDNYSTNTDAKVYTVSISDGRCDYTPADDTLRIHTRTDISNSCRITTWNDTACYNGSATLYARSDLAPPYTIRWYDDYALTKLRKEEVMTNAEDSSALDTNYLTQRAMVYVSVEEIGSCPTVYGVPTHTVSMADGVTTAMQCGQTYRFYDSGGESGEYATNEDLTHTFTTADGRPVAIHFDELDLSTTSSLMLFSGTATLEDSLLCELTAGSANPGMIYAKGGTLTVLFLNGNVAKSGWSAIVEPMPGLAIAEVRPENTVFLSYEVCQSQTNDWMTTYGNPYGIVPDVASLTALNANMRKARSLPYVYKKTLPKADRYGCDSTVTFSLTVLPPSHFDTTIVTTNLHGTTCKWLDSTFTTHGQHAYLHILPDGCDSLDLVNFIILQVDTSTNQFCEGDSTIMGVSVTEPPMVWRTDYTRPTVNIGDIVCTDSTIMDVETFIQGYPDHGKWPKGVVFYVDSTGEHGLIMALTNSPKLQFAENYVDYQDYAYLPTYSVTQPQYWATVMDGYYRTYIIKQVRKSLFKTKCPAVAWCYYYDPDLLNMGEEHKGWWMPATGELYLLYANRGEINAVLKKLKKDFNTKVSLFTETYWSTTASHAANKSFQTIVLVTENGYGTAKVWGKYVALPITSF